MKKVLKEFVRRHYMLYMLVTSVIEHNRRIRSCLFGNNVFLNKGCARVKKDIIGFNNKVIIEKYSILHNTQIRFRGNNNQLIIGEGCMVGPNCSFWLEGNNITVKVGEKNTFTHTVHFCAQEDNMKIETGSGCMFSNNIIVRTSDSHPIYDALGKRINPPQPVIIGDNVWIAPNSKVMKGAFIGDNAIVGSDSMVTSKPVPNNTLSIGHPARVVKEGISWTREYLFLQ